MCWQAGRVDKVHRALCVINREVTVFKLNTCTNGKNKTSVDCGQND
jgi:hypothetical protein